MKNLLPLFYISHIEPIVSIEPIVPIELIGLIRLRIAAAGYSFFILYSSF